MSKEVKCPGCDDPLTIINAKHTYTIHRDDNGKWCKDIGDVEYTCDGCEWILSVNEIIDILRQVDEL